jgi:hypothetical protein
MARSHHFDRGARACLRGMALLCLATPAVSQTVSLYENDFETPNVQVMTTCGLALDQRGINFLYGRPEATFQQQFTVEAVIIHPYYSDPSGIGGNYALGMLESLQPDLLALTVDAQGRNFINVGMDISSIDVQGWGGPFGIADPVFRITLVDSPGGVFTFGQPWDVLDEVEITGAVGPGPLTFSWTNQVVALDASGSTPNGKVTVVWDLLQSGYAAFDNLILTASNTAGDLDTTPPTLVCPSAVSRLDPKSSSPGEIVVFSVTANDDTDPAPSVLCTPPSGSFFPRGTTVVTAIATDASGNQATCTFPVIVLPTVRPRR